VNDNNHFDAKEEADRLLDWHPLSEPPYTERWVLVKDQDGGVFRVYYTGSFNFSEEMHDNLFHFRGTVPTHWKPSIE